MIQKLRLSSVVAFLCIAAVLYARLPPPAPASAQFSSQGAFVGTSGGSANAQTLSIPNVSSYANLKGVPISFLAGFTNTGPLTITVNALAPVSLVRFPNGQAFGGGEIFGYVTIVHTGSAFAVVSPQDLTPVGTAIEVRGIVAPPGYLVEDGSCVSQTNYSALFAVISTNYGSCGAGLFALPDSRGTLFAAADTQGANGPANRITNAGSGCVATTVPFSCGAQNKIVAVTYLPASGLSVPGLSVPSLTTSAVSVPGLSVPGLSVPGLSVPSLSVAAATTNVGTIPLSSGAISSLQTQGNPTANITPANASGTWSGATSLAATGTTGTGTTGTGTTGTGTTGTGTTGTGTTGTGTTGTGTTGNMGSGIAMPVLNPILGGLRVIKY